MNPSHAHGDSPPAPGTDGGPVVVHRAIGGESSVRVRDHVRFGQFTPVAAAVLFRTARRARCTHDGPAARRTPTPRLAARRPRSARAGTRSSRGSPGGEKPGPGEPPKRRLTLQSFHRLTLGMPGHWRRRLFESLPESLQAGAWAALGDDVDRERWA